MGGGDVPEVGKSGDDSPDVWMDGVITWGCGVDGDTGDVGTDVGDTSDIFVGHDGAQ